MMSHDDKLDVLIDRVAEVRERLTSLEVTSAGICSRLDRLNGSVARHEEAIAKLQLEQAARQGEQKATNKWATELKPIAWAALTTVVILALAHADLVSKMLGR